MNTYWLLLIVPACILAGVALGVYAIISICNALTRREK